MDDGLLERAEDWSMSRGITQQAPEHEGFLANITMELGEFLDVPKYKDEFDAIDAVADIVVFSITELFKIGVFFPPNIVNILKGGHTFMSWYGDIKMTEDSTNNGFNRSIFRCLAIYENTHTPANEEAIGAISTITTLCLNKMVTMGYNPLVVMDEVLKVVESRVGKWDSVSNKFQKDMSESAKSKWYKPKYMRARVR